MKKGQKLTVFIQPSESGGMKLKPIILEAEPNRELRWRGSIHLPKLLKGEQILRIKPSDRNSVQFIHKKGFLVY